MGREAYRMGAKFMNPEIPKEKIVEELLSLGAYDTKKGQYGQVDMEVAFKEGYLEMLIYKQNEYKKLLNATVCFNDIDMNSKSVEAPDIAVIEMRFAKANSVDLVDKIIELMRTLKERGIVKEVGDLESRQTIDLSDYSAFKERVKQAHEEFLHWNGEIPIPIRCTEVYETLHSLYPERYRVTTSDKLV